VIRSGWAERSGYGKEGEVLGALIEAKILVKGRRKE